MSHVFMQKVSSTPLPSPKEVLNLLPTSRKQETFVLEARKDISAVLRGQDPRLLLICGPCSIHDPDFALSYATRLKELSERVSDTFVVVMRCYFEKPRTSLGWKGLLYDPDLNGSDDVYKGILRSRELLIQLAELKLPAATEFLDPTTPGYLEDLISWGSIGSRTSESQIHRQMVSGLAAPTGFKNGTDGSLDVAIHAVAVAKTPQTLLSISEDGRLCVKRTSGNPNCHIVLRGGSACPNFDAESVEKAAQALVAQNLNSRLVIDCAHDNCGKILERQEAVFLDVIDQIHQGSHHIAGLILESYLAAGSQDHNTQNIRGDISLTDPCLDWEATEELVLFAHKTLKGSVASRATSHDSLVLTP